MSTTAKFMFFLALLFPVYGLSRDAVIATGVGNAKLNGRTLLHLSAVFAGDKLQTESDSAIVLHGKGFSAQVGPMADSVLETDALLLGTGGVEATGLINILAGDVRIVSDSAKTMFTVYRSAGTVSVSVKSGLAIVRRGRERVELKPGEARTFADGVKEKPVQISTKHSRTAAKTSLEVGAGSAAGVVVATHLKDSKNDQVSISPSRR
jgi:hypothetical protein